MPGFKVIVITDKMQQTIATGLGSVNKGFEFIREFANELCWRIATEDQQNRFAIGIFRLAEGKGAKVITFKVERE